MMEYAPPDYQERLEEEERRFKDVEYEKPHPEWIDKLFPPLPTKEKLNDRRR